MLCVLQFTHVLVPHFILLANPQSFPAFFSVYSPLMFPTLLDNAPGNVSEIFYFHWEMLSREQFLHPFLIDKSFCHSSQLRKPLDEQFPNIFLSLRGRQYPVGQVYLFIYFFYDRLTNIHPSALNI